MNNLSSQIGNFYGYKLIADKLLTDGEEIVSIPIYSRKRKPRGISKKIRVGVPAKTYYIDSVNRLIIMHPSMIAILKEDIEIDLGISIQG
jgi:hypothetical protein